MSAIDFLWDPTWRADVDFLVDVLGCTRYQAADLLARAWSNGYNRKAMSA